MAYSFELRLRITRGGKVLTDQHTYSPGKEFPLSEAEAEQSRADDYLYAQAEAEIGRANDEEPQPPQHTKTESLIIAAEDFVADVDELLHGAGAVYPIELPVFGSVKRLRQAIDAVRGESDGN